MNRHLVVGFVGLAACAASASAQVVVQVFPSPAPNFFGSTASYNGWEANSIASLAAGGGGNIGSRSTDPTAYETGSNFEVYDFIATGYNMWRGGVNNPAPFANELGHRMHYGVRIVAQPGTQFSASQVTFTTSSTDSINWAAWSGNLGGSGYSSGKVGVLRGVDGMVGTSDDVLITSGPATQAVDALYYVGVGIADESLINATTYSDGVTPYAYSNTPNPAIAYAESAAGFNDYFGAGWQMSATYNVIGFSGTGTATLIPAPGAIALVGMGGLVATRRRRA